MAKSIRSYRSSQMRRALGRIRRSPALAHTTRFIGVQRRRWQQRIHARFVRGVHLRTTDYLDQLARHDRGQYFPIVGFDGATRVAAPTFVPDTPADPVGGPILVTSGPHGVASLNRPWVLGRNGAVLGDDQKLLWDISYEWPGDPQHHSCYGQSGADAPDVAGTTVALAAMGADGNYFHLLLNSVARLLYLEHPLSAYRPDRFLITGEVNDFVAETFALFGVARDRLIGTADYPAFRPERLIVPPVIQHPFVVPAHVVEFVRAKVLAKLPPPAMARRRIMVDRSDANARRVQNLNDLDPLLAQFGIELVRLQGLSVLEQAALFRDAELVIANHGAALTNLVFCEPGTRVFQLLAPGMMEREYRTISQHARLHHDYVVADFATPDDADLPLKQRDLELSSKLLRNVLAR